jgi:tetratricopeptide (TPR) repeat protein
MKFKYKQKASLCEEALSVFPSCPIFLYNSAEIHYKLKEYDKSIGYFQTCLVLGKSGTYNPILAFPKDILGVKSLTGLGYCFFKSRKYEKAIQHFEKSYLLKKDEKAKIMLDVSRFLLTKQRKNKPSYRKYISHEI